MNDPSTRAKDMKSMPCPKIFGPFPPFFKKKENSGQECFFIIHAILGGGM
jgi:hypothetical protein